MSFAPDSGSMYRTSVTGKTRDSSGAASSNSCAVQQDTAMDLPPTPRAKANLRPSRRAMSEAT